jgi:hypothetical protein
MIQFYIWLAVFAVIGYFIVTDQSIAQFFLLTLANAKLTVQRRWFMMMWHIQHNPRNPFVKWHLDRKYNDMAKELHAMYNTCDD